MKHRKRYFLETPFEELMQNRIHKILLICSSYDAFMLEEDGRIDEQIFMEYASLNLRYPPQFVQASSESQAFEVLKNEKIDLIITMLSVDDPFALAKRIKNQHSKIPIVLLTPFLREITIRLERKEVTGAIDYIFCWLGNADLLLAIVKLIEDLMNVEPDTKIAGVQNILLVEDNIRFYSSYLPTIYKIILKQSQEFMSEGLNEHQQMLRMRGRPKILLATNFEKAVAFYEKYRDNLLGIISDVNYEREGKNDSQAGIKFCQMVKNEYPHMPFLLQSSEAENSEKAHYLKASFLDKNSKAISFELKELINRDFAFGDFVFRNPNTNAEVLRVSDLKSLQGNLFLIPDDSFLYHASRHHLSKWLSARALFPIAEFLRNVTVEDFKTVGQIKHFLFDTIANFRMNKGRGIISKFYPEKFDEYLTFSRIGNGSLGGKARGLAFVDNIIKKYPIFENFEDVIISIPKTVVISTDVFDEFMSANNLYEIGLSNLEDEEILRHFVRSRLPNYIETDLRVFVSVVKNPIAVRSSSLLEDSHYQPFAGIYSTYMIPNVADQNKMIDLLSTAIKSVYASVYFKDSKAYMAATSNVIDEEKMAIVLQEVAGKQHGDHFYPIISGVARSFNFYPIPPEKPEDGIVTLAFGLGKYIVDGGATLRFSPKYPQKILQLSNTRTALHETQKFFYALDMNPESFKPSLDEGINLRKYKIADAESDGTLNVVSSVYDFHNDILRDGEMYSGKRVLTFANILKYNSLPLTEILQKVLQIGQKEMNNAIEIEFVLDMEIPRTNPAMFYILQIRPIVENNESVNENLEDILPQNTLLYSKSALGNGVTKNLFDVVYVKTDAFNPAKNQETALKIGALNEKFVAEGRNYILIGPGRWGSSDHWLGVPVKWTQISAARVIVESGLENYRIDPSQGTHFFQNLTSFRVGYFTINQYKGDGHFDIAYLSNLPAIYEDEAIRHIRFENPLIVKIDGKKNIGVVLKP